MTQNQPKIKKTLKILYTHKKSQLNMNQIFVFYTNGGRTLRMYRMVWVWVDYMIRFMYLPVLLCHAPDNPTDGKEEEERQRRRKKTAVFCFCYCFVFWFVCFFSVLNVCSSSSYHPKWSEQRAKIFDRLTQLCVYYSCLNDSSYGFNVPLYVNMNQNQTKNTATAAEVTVNITNTDGNAAHRRAQLPKIIQCVDI